MNLAVPLVRGLAAMLALCAAAAQADFRVDIRKGVERGIPIALMGETSLEQNAMEVIAADLRRSGFFRVLEEDEFDLVPRESGYNRKAWRSTPAEYVAQVRMKELSPRRVQVDFRLHDVLAEKTVLARRLTGNLRYQRRLAHQVADALHEQITGIPGAFDTRIAYISQTRVAGVSKYRLFVADSDGHNPIAILTSPNPLLSPAWSPDGLELAYVSFEARRPQVFIQNLSHAARRPLPDAASSSSAPAFSPDGKYLAMAMSFDGDTEIVLYDLKTEALRRFTYSSGIDTEPAWEADGQALIFTSDRSGRPKLYRQGLKEEQARALPLSGSYTSDAEVSSNGRYLAFVQTTEVGGYGITLYEPESEGWFPLSSGTLDEAPSFAPNGFSLIYASTSRAGERLLMLATHNGRIRQRLGLKHSDAREPAWSPYRY